MRVLKADQGWAVEVNCMAVSGLGMNGVAVATLT